MTKTYEQLLLEQIDLETIAMNDNFMKKQAAFEDNIDDRTEYNNSAYGSRFFFEVADAVTAFVKAQHKKSNQTRIKFYMDNIRTIQDEVEGTKEYGDVEARIGEIVAMNLVGSLSRGSHYSSAAKAIFKDLCWLLNTFPESDYDGMAYSCKLVKIASEDTDLFTIEFRNGRDLILEPAEHVIEEINEARSKIQVAASSHKAMLVAPNPHTSLLDTNGGAIKMKTPLLKRPRKTDEGNISPAVKNFTSETNPEWFDIMNAKMATPYDVNTKLLDVIEEYYAMGYTFNGHNTAINFDLAEAEADEEIEYRNKKNKKFKDDVNSGKRPVPKPRKRKGQVETIPYDPVWKPLTAHTCLEIKKGHISTQTDIARLAKSILKQARYFSNYDAIYFHGHCDHRQRFYTYPTEFSYQGNELAKALIHQAEKVEVTEEGIIDILETLANALGYDKKTCEVKRPLAAKWWRENVETFKAGDFSMFFIDSHKDDNDKTKMFEEPITALGLTLELLAIDADPSYKTGVILHRDARLSGSSIIGTILRDRGVMVKTSVLPEAEDAVALEDGYRDVADRVKDEAQKMADKGSELALDLLDHNEKLMTRGALKFPTMAGPSYGLTVHGIKEHTRKLIKWDELMSSEHKALFDKLVIGALRTEMPSCYQWMDALDKAAKDVIKRDGSFSFTQPMTGFPVELWKQTEKTRRAEITSNFRTIKVSLNIPTGKTDVGATQREVSPSTIHSVDAAILVLVDKKIGGAFPTTTIHDSIGATPGNVQKVVAAYREVMHELATSDLFSIIFDQLGITEEVPYINTATAEDIASILKAKHILA